jgi:hypothetical protein
MEHWPIFSTTIKFTCKPNNKLTLSNSYRLSGWRPGEISSGFYHAYNICHHKIDSVYILLFLLLMIDGGLTCSTHSLQIT